MLEVYNLFSEQYAKVLKAQRDEKVEGAYTAAKTYFDEHGYGFDSKEEEDAFKEYLKGENEEYVKYTGDILKTLREGGFETEDFINSSKEAAMSTNNLTASLGALKKASEGLSTLSSAFKEMNESGFVSIGTIAKIKEVLGDSVEDWDKYQNILMTSKKGSAEFNGALNDLTFKMLEATMGTVELKFATEDQIAALLRENGIANADALAVEYLAKVKGQAAIESFNFGEITESNINDLIAEGTAAGLTEGQMYSLIISHILFNDTSLNPEQKVDALMQVMVAAGMAKEAIDKVLGTGINDAAGVNNNSSWADKEAWVKTNNIKVTDDAQGRKGKTKDGKEYDYKDYIYNGVRYDTIDEAKAAVAVDEMRKNSNVNGTFDFTTPIYTNKDSSKKKEDAERKALEQFKAGLEMRKKVIERYKDALDLTDFGMDVAEENDFALRADLLNNKMSQITSYGEAMRKEFDRVTKIIPKTGEEADALASHIQDLGSDMRANINTLRETRVAMEKLKVDSIVSVGDYYLEDLNSALDNIESRIEKLTNDNNEDYEYTNKILNLEALLPTRSGTWDVRNKRRNADQDIINAEQATQDAINDILETQIQKNKELREEERQALLVDMETMRQDTVLKLESAQADYGKHWSEVQSLTDSGVSSIEKAIDGLDIKIKKPDISQVVEACEQVKEMLENMGNADYTPPSIRISDGVDGGDASSIIKGNRANIVSNIAKNQLGVPYVWGGVAPGRGLDCSGLTRYAYGVAGVSLPRVADDQWKCGIGTQVDWKDLKKGDQLFFGSENKATHTGIYVGGGQMIHAPRTGDVVKYASINSEYFQSNFLGAKRYAVGTPKGNAQAHRLGIAGENFKPEILIDKATGRATYIDKPTVIDITTTDVVGEKATAEMPKFATGTIDPKDIARYIKETYPEVTNAGIAAILANINQESGFDPKQKTTERYGSGSNKLINRWGLFQLDDTRISNWSDVVQNGVWQQQIDIVIEEGRYKNSGMGSKSQYNVWDNVLTKDGLSAAEAARLFDQLYERSDGKSREKRAIAAEGYLKEIERWSDTIDDTFKDGALDGVDIIDDIQNLVNKEMGVIEEEVSKTLAKTIKIDSDESLTDTQKAIENFKVFESSAKTGSKTAYESYTNLLNQFIEWYDAVEAGTEDFSQEIFDAYLEGLDKLKEGVTGFESRVASARETILADMDDALSEIDDYISEHDDRGDWGRIGDTKADAIRREKEILSQYRRDGILSEKDFIKRMKELDNAEVEAEFEHSSNWIAERNTYNDWVLFDDSEVDAWERVVKWLNEEYPEDIAKIKEAEQNLFEARKNEFSKATEFGNSYLESQKTLLQSHFNIENSIAEARHEINKELETSKTMYEWLDEDSRQLLFNQEDYNELSRELLEIEGEAGRLQKQYQEDLDGATLETIESITANYERQYETLMKSYEIAKADLEVAKKKQKLNNVLNERNVRMFINGSWQWVANTEDVINAKSELADAEYAKQVEEAGLTQKQSIDALSKQQDELALVVKEFEGGVISLGDAVAQAANAIGYIPQAMEDMLKRAEVDTETYTSGSSSKSYGDTWYDSNENYMNKIRGAQSKEEVRAYNEARNAKIYGEGMDKDLVMTNAEAVKEWEKFHWSWDSEYATGTKNTQSGLALMGEDGREIYITTNGRLIPINQPTIGNIPSGGVVFNADQMKTVRSLWDMSNLNLNADRSYINRQSQQTTQSIDNRIIINGMTVDSGSSDGQALISALRRYVGNH